MLRWLGVQDHIGLALAKALSLSVGLIVHLWSHRVLLLLALLVNDWGFQAHVVGLAACHGVLRHLGIDTLSVRIVMLLIAGRAESISRHVGLVAHPVQRNYQSWVHLAGLASADQLTLDEAKISLLVVR